MHRFSLRRNNRRTGLVLAVLCCMMVGLSFASVPLYDLFCRATGFGGRPQQSDSPTSRMGKGYDDSSPALHDLPKIRVRFDANVSAGLDWFFAPSVVEKEVFLGEVYETSYIAKNLSQDALLGVATFNVSPQKTGVYFHKIECFCFKEQRLEAGEEVMMKVVFFVDPALREYAEWGSFDTITLSYSFFPHSDGS